ncbi:uncharacterized protein LOC144022201 [Festucalex cinctus]
MSTTCHICKITFRRVMSLSLHLDNAHCPPVCCKCSQSFSTAWELNKHAQEPCLGSAVERSELASDVNYDWGRPLDSDDAYEMSTDASASNASEDDSDFDVNANESELSDSSSAESTDFADYSSRGEPAAPANKNTICESCGRGPFRSLKLHLRHCIRLLSKTFQCSRCMMLFSNEAALKEHRAVLYSCDSCGQVFSNLHQHRPHQPPNRGRIRLMCFCSESIPKTCAICKSLFSSEKFLLTHVTEVHTSVVGTKLCVDTKPPGLTDNKAFAESPLQPVVNTKQVINGQLPTDHTYSVSAQVQTSHHDPACSTPLPAIPALLEDQNPKLAPIEPANTRVPRSCRECGAVLRQPSLAISHRYLHRGRRSHRCQCGRAFKHRLHLLRHCVQHAEAESYICVNCGNTFTGARLLAEHLRGEKWKKGKCRMPLACSCGHFFYRASAYIWHQIKNNVKSRCFENIYK